MNEKPRVFRHLAVTGDGIMVCLDSAEENMVPAMALHADHVLDETWNGWARPIATAAALSDFLARWRVNDRHGTWGRITEAGDTLRYQDSDGNDPEDFPRVGATPTGEALYDLSGWVWTLL